MRRQIPDPTSKEEDAISVASIMLKAVISNQSWNLLMPMSRSKHTPSLRDLHAMEDANYALRHLKASYTGASPFSVLEDDLLCLRGIPHSGLHEAQRLTEMGGGLVNDLRLIAGEQFDQAEKDSKSHRALASVQNKIPIAQRLFFCKYLLKRFCHSKPLIEQLSADLDYVFSTGAKLVDTYLSDKTKEKLKESHPVHLLYHEKTIFTARQLYLIKGVEKRCANVISRVERLPDCDDKESLLVECEAERACWAVLGGVVQTHEWGDKRRSKREKLRSKR
jgi:hypothetical protein